MKQKTFFIIFKEPPVAKNCFRLESVPLIFRIIFYLGCMSNIMSFLSSFIEKILQRIVENSWQKNNVSSRCITF